MIKQNKAYKIEYVDGRTETAIAKSSLEIIKRYDLTTKEHIKTRVIELSGNEAFKAFMVIR